MRKLSLSEWASISDVIGMVGVIISLIFVAVNLERNTRATTNLVGDESFKTIRETNLALLNNPELFDITMRAVAEPTSLSPAEIEKYEIWLHINLDTWERQHDWETSGLIDSEDFGWDAYFEDWFTRFMTPANWAEIRWRYTEPRFRDKVDKLMGYVPDEATGRLDK